jgi:hypothetical protein
MNDALNILFKDKIFFQKIYLIMKNNNTVEFIKNIHYYFNLTTAITISIIGLVGNTLVFYILTRPKFLKQSIFRYFLVTTGNNSFVLLTMWFYCMPDLFLMNSNSLSCKLTQYFGYLFYQFCPWIIVLNSFDRYLSVHFPTKFEFRTKLKYQVLALSIIFFNVKFDRFSIFLLL